MRYASFIAVAALTFFVGLLVHLAFQANIEIPSSAQAQEDEWHKLYEAAAMSDDDFLKQKVGNSLKCLDVIDEPNGWVILTPDNEAYCKSANGEIRKMQWMITPTTERRIRESQVEWSVKNLDFVRSLSDKNKARQYVVAHLSN